MSISCSDSHAHTSCLKSEQLHRLKTHLPLMQNGLVTPADLANAVSLRTSLLSHPYIESILGLSVDAKGAVWSYSPITDDKETLEAILISRFKKGKTNISKGMADMAAGWLEDVVEALSFMHTCSDTPIYHGSLRPSCVLISNDSTRATLSGKYPPTPDLKP